MTGFHDVLFPVRLAFGARGGPERRVQITRLSNGQEVRNSSQSLSRRIYDAGTALKSKGDIYELLNFFEARAGALYAFRFRDPMDHRSGAIDAPVTALDQAIGQGDGVQQDFALIKTYFDAQGEQIRPITKPRIGTLSVAINGAITEAYSLSPLTGVISFTIPPALGDVITAGYEFDTPVRFDTERLDISLDAFGAGEIPSIPLIELLDHA